MSPIRIRPETTADHAAVARVIAAAFREAEHSDHREHLLVARLRRDPGFVPELSLVAESAGGEVVGHILLTPVHLAGVETEERLLALAPVAVHPDRQGKGIGGHLIEAGHAAARRLAFGAVILLGHAEYYPRFGYVRADRHGIELPFPAPPENCLVRELWPGALAGLAGRVVYPPAFPG